MAQYIGLADSDFVQGGLLSDVDIAITALQFRGWDYNGTIQEDVLAVRMELTILDEKGNVPKDATPTEQFFSCGPKLEEVSVADDGYHLIPGSKAGLVRGSNFHIFLSSLFTLGMPKDYLADGDISKLLNAKLHVVRVPAPKRDGIQAGKKDYDPQVLVANKVMSGSWDKGGKKGAAAAKSTNAATPAPAASTGAANGAAASGNEDVSDTQQIAESSIKQVLTDNPVVANVSDLAVKVFRMHDKLDQGKRTAVVNLVKSLMKNQEWCILNNVNLSESGEVTLSS